MWMETYVQYVLIRERRAEAEAAAARYNLLRERRPSPTPSRFRTLLARLVSTITARRRPRRSLEPVTWP
jgi:hypothetical protein